MYYQLVVVDKVTAIATFHPHPQDEESGVVKSNQSIDRMSRHFFGARSTLAELRRLRLREHFRTSPRHF
jgi:hypothetical protein